MLVKYAIPVLAPSADEHFYCPVKKDDVAWMRSNVYNPAAIVRDGLLHLVFRADAPYGEGRDACGNNKMTCRLGHATSKDGTHFEVSPEPVLYPQHDSNLQFEWWGGCQDLHIIEGTDGRYYMNYDGWTGSYDARYEYGACGGPWQDVLLSAVSEDLVHWDKMGPALPDTYKALWNHSRSGTVISRVKNGRLIAEKIRGKYWMYMSHRGYLASSDDLIRWTPEFTQDGKLACLFPQYPLLEYCARSCEAGAAAILTSEGIRYFFNAMQPNGIWTLGEALIDADAVLKVLSVDEKPVLQPEYEWECNGHTAKPATVCNTLVYFGGAWRMYYGAADHVIGMAVWQ